MCESIVVVGAALSADVDAPTERVHSAPGARRGQSPKQPTGERAGRETQRRFASGATETVETRPLPAARRILRVLEAAKGFTTASYTPVRPAAGSGAPFGGRWPIGIGMDGKARPRLWSRRSYARAEAARAFVRRSLGRSRGRERGAIRAFADTRERRRKARAASRRLACHEIAGASARPATPRWYASRVRRRPALRAVRRRARAPAACP